MLPHAPSSLPRYGASADPRPVHPSPVIDSRAPPRSSLEVEGSREVGTNLAPRMTAMATMGMLTRKIEPHEKWLSRSPPQDGAEGDGDAGAGGPQADRLGPLLGVG